MPHLARASQAALGLNVGGTLRNLRASTGQVDRSTLRGRPRLPIAIAQARQLLAQLEHALATLAAVCLILLLQLAIDLHLLRLKHKLVRVLSIVLSESLLKLLLDLVLSLRIVAGCASVHNEAIVVDVNVLHGEVQIVIFHGLDV